MPLGRQLTSIQVDALTLSLLGPLGVGEDVSGYTAPGDLAALFRDNYQALLNNDDLLSRVKADIDPVTGKIVPHQWPEDLAGTWRGVHDPALFYNSGEAVRNAEATAWYRAKQDVPAGTAITSTTYWEQTLNLGAATGATTFVALTDTPAAFPASTSTARWVRANAGGTALEFADLPAASGGFPTLVRAQRTTNYGMGTDYFGIIALDEVTDANAEYDPATGLFTPKVSGLYEWDMTIWVQDSAAGDITTLGIFAGGGTTGTLVRYLSINYANVAGERDAGGVRMVYLTAGTGYGVRVKNSTTGKNIRGTANATATSPQPFNLRIARVA